MVGKDIHIYPSAGWGRGHMHHVQCAFALMNSLLWSMTTKNHVAIVLRNVETWPPRNRVKLIGHTLKMWHPLYTTKIQS